MIIGRAGGWMEWSGAVKGRAGVAVVFGGGGEEKGDGSDHPPHFRLRLNGDGVVCVVRETSVVR